MKKVLMAALALIGFSAATLAQTTPAAKTSDPAKVQVVKKTTDKKDNGKAVAMNKAVKPAAAAPSTGPVVNKATSASTKPAAATSPGAAAPLKKDGTPDKRYKANQGSTAGPVKKDGTPDMRYKANKKKG